MMEDIGTKKFKFVDSIGKELNIHPNYGDYKKEGEDGAIFLSLRDKDYCEDICYGLSISQAKEVIESLNSIIEYIERKPCNKDVLELFGATCTAKCSCEECDVSKDCSEAIKDCYLN